MSAAPRRANNPDSHVTSIVRHAAARRRSPNRCSLRIASAFRERLPLELGQVRLVQADACMPLHALPDVVPGQPIRNQPPVRLRQRRVRPERGRRVPAEPLLPVARRDESPENLELCGRKKHAGRPQPVLAPAATHLDRLVVAVDVAQAHGPAGNRREHLRQKTFEIVPIELAKRRRGEVHEIVVPDFVADVRHTRVERGELARRVVAADHDASRSALGLAGRERRVHDDGLALDIGQLLLKELCELLLRGRVFLGSGPDEDGQHPHVSLTRSASST